MEARSVPSFIVDLFILIIIFIFFFFKMKFLLSSKLDTFTAL